MNLSKPIRGIVVFAMLACALPAVAADSVATFKKVEGDVRVERAGKEMPATTGMNLMQADTVRTGNNGAAGITFEDNALISLGANGQLVIDQFRYDRATQGGEFQTTLSKGRMAVVSGKIAKHHVDAMKVRTPTALLGVRGTEFLVDAGQ